MGILLSAHLSGQEEKTTGQSEIVMTKAELKSFLATIAEARRVQLKARKEKADKAYLNELRTKYENFRGGQVSGDILSEQLLRELRYLHQRIDGLGQNKNAQPIIPRSGSDNSTIIIPGNSTSSVYTSPQGATKYIQVPQKERQTPIAESTDGIMVLQRQIDSLKALQQEKLALPDDSAYMDSTKTAMQGLKNQLDSLEMRIAEANNPENRKILLEELIKKYENFKKQVYFDNNSTEVKMAYAGQIQEIVLLLEKYPELSVMLEGWASPVGNSKYNKQLSMQRAESVEEALVANGVSDQRIITAFRGEDKSSSEAEARRVDMSVVLK